MCIRSHQKIKTKQYLLVHINQSEAPLSLSKNVFKVKTKTKIVHHLIFFFISLKYSSQHEIIYQANCTLGTWQWLHRPEVEDLVMIKFATREQPRVR